LGIINFDVGAATRLPNAGFGFVSWCFRPFEEPAMTEIVIVLSFWERQT
jgi:hypothetical protein